MAVSTSAWLNLVSKASRTLASAANTRSASQIAGLADEASTLLRQAAPRQATDVLASEGSRIILASTIRNLDDGAAALRSLDLTQGVKLLRSADFGLDLLLPTALR